MCWRIAKRVVNFALIDPTAGATHNHARGVWPLWARGKAPSAKIGNHLFYNDVR